MSNQNSIQKRTKQSQILSGFEDIKHSLAKNSKLAKILFKDLECNIKKIENTLIKSPSVINYVKSVVPDTELIAILTKEQKNQLAKGAIKLMARKDGNIAACLVNPKTKEIINQVPLKKANLNPETMASLSNLATQMQIAQIAEDIETVKIAVEEVRQGQEFDRLAVAYSCHQKLIQALTIQDVNTKKLALMQVLSDSENCRNSLMLSQKSNLNFILDQPENLTAKFIKGASSDKINKRMEEIRESFNSVNIVSLIEALAYQELNEPDAAMESLSYYANFLNETYLSNPEIINRLDLIDPSPENYWTRILPKIENEIRILPDKITLKYLNEKNSDDK